MRSKEVAELAGVSVRTLRHYHQIGVLPEPDRGANGYRRYELSHLARLLRIRTLAELGVPLEQMPDLLATTEVDAGRELLDDLAEQLELRISKLRGQLRRVEEVRASGARLDLPAALTPFLGVSAGALSGPTSELEEDASILLARLVEAGGVPDDLGALAAFVGTLRANPAYAAFESRYEGLDPEASVTEIHEVASAFLAAFGAEFTRTIDGPMGGRLRRFDAHGVDDLLDDDRINPAQFEVLRLIGEGL